MLTDQEQRSQMHTQSPDLPLATVSFCQLLFETGTLIIHLIQVLGRFFCFPLPKRIISSNQTLAVWECIVSECTALLSLLQLGFLSFSVFLNILSLVIAFVVILSLLLRVLGSPTHSWRDFPAPR